MRIALHDSEKEHFRRKTFPNYALMKISAYHKAIGDTVEWWDPREKYDIVYSSKIFDFTPENLLLPPDTIKGGTGYDIKSALPPEIDDMFPDYSIYPECDYAIGYITRGCPNNCRWCIVPQKEGGIKPYRDWRQLVRQDSKKLVLMDNNILACEYGIEQLESLIGSGYAIDLNQGMDARLVTERTAYIISRLNWIRFIRFSCDTIPQIKAIEKAITLLQSFGVKPYKLFIYLLVTPDLDNAAERVERLKKFKGINIYAQAERNDGMGIVPNKLQLEFAQRYVYSGKYRRETWREYCDRKNMRESEEMQTYICKCGKTFNKSSKADSTGYVLKDYSPQHECFGCPFIVIERDWQTKEIVKRECRATPQITYSTRCHIGTADGDHTACHLYTLDLYFARRVMNYIKTLDGAANKQGQWTDYEPNSIPTEWRAADFGKCYAFKDCFGLAIFPLMFQNNKKGTEARRAVMEHFFTPDGRRKDVYIEEAEKKIVLKRIAIAMESARTEHKQSQEDSAESFSDNKQEGKNMTAAFDLGSMLGGAPSVVAENKVQQIPCDMLVPYHNHKFELYSGERLDDMVSSIRENGVLIPIIVQPISGGKYEILIGHNRWNASKLAGNPTVPGIIKEGLSEEEAEMYVIESNLMQRGFDDLKISEQAAVVAMRHSQMFSQGKRNDIIRELEQLENPATDDDDTLSPMDTKSDTNKEIGAEYGLSRATVARLIRIDKLTDGLKPLVDDGTIPLRAAVNISYLTEDSQIKLIKLAKLHKIDIKKSEQLREYSDSQELDQLTIVKILTGLINDVPKPPKPKSVKISNDVYSRYFDEKAKPDEIAETVEKALELYFANKEIS